MADATWKDKTYNEYYQYLKNGYNPNAQVQQAQKQLNSLKKPQGYTSAYKDSIASGINKYMGSTFDYNHNNDPAYQRQKQEYTQNAQKAMNDTVGQVSALTGGYGNSYAQAAGQETYNAYMKQLTDVIDTLESKAYARYQDENSRLLNGINLMQAQDSTDYSRYRDTVNDYYTDRDYYANRYDTERSFDYNKYADVLDAYYNNAMYQDTNYWNTVNQENTDRQFNYNAQQDAIANQLAREQFAYEKEQDAIANQLAREQFAHGKEQDAIANQLAREQFDYEKELNAGESYQVDMSPYYDTINKMIEEEMPTKEDLATYIDQLDLTAEKKYHLLTLYDCADVWNDMYGPISLKSILLKQKDGKNTIVDQSVLAGYNY